MGDDNAVEETGGSTMTNEDLGALAGIEFNEKPRDMTKHGSAEMALTTFIVDGKPMSMEDLKAKQAADDAEYAAHAAEVKADFDARTTGSNKKVVAKSEINGISKSTRHSKVTGEYGEALVLYFLSKYGFECANVDHTGIDLIARNPHKPEVMGISVKSRCRGVGKEEEYLSIPADNFTKAKFACEAFHCVPYFAIVIDAGNFTRVFLLTMEHLLTLFPATTSASGWKMSKKYIDQYYADPKIKIFEMEAKMVNWGTVTKSL